MIALDTNVIVRFLARDDVDKWRKATDLIRGRGRLWVSRTVLLETVWALRSVYRLEMTDVLEALSSFLRLPAIALDDADAVHEAFRLTRSGLDFEDAIHVAYARNASEPRTFDEGFIKRAKKAKSQVPVVPV